MRRVRRRMAKLVSHGRRLPWLALVVALAAAWPSVARGSQASYQLEGGQWQRQGTVDPASPEGGIRAIRSALAYDRAREAEQLATEWIREHPGHRLMPEARLLRGDAIVARQRYYRALFDYEHVIRYFPDSEQFHQAIEREFWIADQFSRGVRRHFLGMRVLPAYSEAEELLIRIQERAPGTAIGEQASFRLAEHYSRRGEVADAVEAYDLFLLNYPESARAEQALRASIQASLERVNGPPFDPTGLIEARERLRRYAEQYPVDAETLDQAATNERIDEALAEKDLRTARWFDQRGERISAAFLYERVVVDHPGTSAAEQADERIDAMNLPVRPGVDGRGREADPPQDGEVGPAEPDDQPQEGL